MELYDHLTNCYIYNCTQFFRNQLMDQFDEYYGIEENTILTLVNVKSHLRLDMMPPPREINGMAEEMFRCASFIYAALMKHRNVLVYFRTGSS